VAYRDGKEWATETIKTADAPARLEASPDRAVIRADGVDLSFVTVRVVDKNGLIAPRANNHIKFKITGPGEIVATDNGDPTNFEPFHATERNAFNGLCLVIIRGKPGQPGMIEIRADSTSLQGTSLTLQGVAENK
jgi:beta-galactosidase